MRPGNQHHAGTDGDETEHGTDLKSGHERADNAGQQGGAERLNERIAAEFGQPAAQGGARAGAQCNKDEREPVIGAEDHAKRRGARCRQQHETHE